MFFIQKQYTRLISSQCRVTFGIESKFLYDSFYCDTWLLFARDLRLAKGTNIYIKRGCGVPKKNRSNSLMSQCNGYWSCLIKLTGVCNVLLNTKWDSFLGLGLLFKLNVKNVYCQTRFYVQNNMFCQTLKARRFQTFHIKHVHYPI